METFLKAGMKLTDFARLWAISTTTLDGWLKAYRGQGPQGLERPYATGRAKGPKRKPLPPALKGEITKVVGRFPFFGLRKIRDFLKRFCAVPVSTHQVRRAIEEEGLPRPAAPKRRRRGPLTVRRFERARPQELWQSEITSFVLPRPRQRVHLTVFLDDCSRYVVSHALKTHQRQDLVVDALREGMGRYGKPREVLTDQGRQYFAWRGKSDFQKLLQREGIAHVVARAHHPQTLGKCERLWETVKTEFFDRVQLDDLEEATTRLAHFFAHYNFARPHQGIEGMVPADRFFQAEDAVRKTLQARLADNELAVGEAPRTPVLLYGRVGEQEVSLHGEKGRLVIQTETGGRQELSFNQLGAPPWRKEEDHDDDARDRDEADPPLQETGALQAGAQDAGAGEGALGGSGGEEAGARHLRGDAGALAGENPQGRGGGETPGDPAPGLATLPTGAGGDGGGAVEATEGEGPGCGARPRRAEGLEGEAPAAGAGSAGEGCAHRPAEGPAGAPGGDAGEGGGEAACNARSEADDGPRQGPGNGSEPCSGSGK